MKRVISPALGALIAGAVFGIGLSLSGMTNPAKVIGFLDITGNWDPSLAFVMGGALIPAVLGFNVKRRNGRLAWACERSPGLGNVKALVLGSALFGIGWGLAGFCPGPAVVRLAFWDERVVVFVIAMLAGMWGGRKVAG
ncbi:MAG: hypothetical protein JJU05_15150 [Verrucomicrobia bacterium]|nr:hypothetical protein [Verrucomicrobiota bacterium]MCH8528151.1 hypothetical protein [Kiritimatiellia bacterium]